MEQAYRTETTVGEGGTLRLDHLPFGAGQTLDVILIPRPRRMNAGQEGSLRGSVIRYDDPTNPVAEAEWEALQ